MTHPAEGTQTDDAEAVTVLAALRHCANACDSNARIVGNIRAGDISRVCRLAINALRSQGGKAPQMERVSLATLAKHFHVPIEAAKLAQDDIGFMYRELAAPTPSPAANAVLVPTEPTQAMISAGQMAGMAHIANAPDDALLADERPNITAAIYRAMVAAFSREESKQP